jgi:hypothetical protein
MSRGKRVSFLDYVTFKEHGNCGSSSLYIDTHATVLHCNIIYLYFHIGYIGDTKFAPTTFAQRHLPRMTFVHKTFAQKDICPDGHLPIRHFLIKHLPRWTSAHKTFAQKEVCPNGHLPRKTFAQKYICLKGHLPRRWIVLGCAICLQFMYSCIQREWCLYYAFVRQTWSNLWQHLCLRSICYCEFFLYSSKLYFW